MTYAHHKFETGREIRCEYAGMPAFETQYMSSNAMTCVEVISSLIEANPDIASMSFKLYHTKETPAAATDLDSIKGAFIYHNDNPAFSVPRRQLMKDDITRMCSTLPQGTCLAAASEVQVFSSRRQFIPMLDFVCEKSDDHGLFLVELLKELNNRVGIRGGFLLESYNSYHYYGRSLLSLDNWTRFIGFSLLMHPPLHCVALANRSNLSSVVDVRYLGHSLIRGESALRISANLDGRLPSVVAMVAP